MLSAVVCVCVCVYILYILCTRDIIILYTSSRATNENLIPLSLFVYIFIGFCENCYFICPSAEHNTTNPLENYVTRRIRRRRRHTCTRATDYPRSRWKRVTSITEDISHNVFTEVCIPSNIFHLLKGTGAHARTHALTYYIIRVLCANARRSRLVALLSFHYSGHGFYLKTYFFDFTRQIKWDILTA